MRSLFGYTKLNHAHALSGVDKFHPYEIVSLLGKGGMARPKDGLAVLVPTGWPGRKLD